MCFLDRVAFFDFALLAFFAGLFAVSAEISAAEPPVSFRIVAADAAFTAANSLFPVAAESIMPGVAVAALVAVLGETRAELSPASVVAALVAVEGADAETIGPVDVVAALMAVGETSAAAEIV